MIRNFAFFLWPLILASHYLKATDDVPTPLTQYVNPFIGTDRGGNTHPGALVPWGMASGSPFTMYGRQSDSQPFTKSGVVAYAANQDYLTGFTHANLSGVGCPDLGSVVLMPTTGEVINDPDVYASRFDNQAASPGYYSGQLIKYNVHSEITATERTIRHRHTFPVGQSNFIINLGLGASDERGGMITAVSDSEVEGFDMFGQFCFEKHYNGRVYFVIRFSQSAKKYGTWHDDYLQEGFNKSAIGDQVGAFYSFDTSEGEQIEVSVGISYVSIANARQNLDAEQGDTTFDNLRQLADSKWEKQLSSVQVKGGTTEEKTNFYTGLYHMLIHPNVFSDTNGEYMGMDGTVRKTTKHDRYSIFSLWDTYRNLHPFLSLVFPERQEAMVSTLIDMYDESGRLPQWELAGKETFVMVGDPAAIVINDSYKRGINSFDTELALEAMTHSARDTSVENWIRPGLKDYLTLGYIPHERSGINPAIKPLPWGSVSTTLEYALADWNIAQFASEIGEMAVYEEFLVRSEAYKNVLHKNSHFLLPKMATGRWHESAKKDPGTSEVGFVEGNAWNYNFFVPHDIEGLRDLIGHDNMLNKLQECFDDDHFVLWNEPDMSYPYLFNYFSGEEWRTSKEVHKAVKKHFHNGADGLPGNDDCGTISAWLVLSMMGLYPDLPGKPNFTLSSPMFEEVTIRLSDGYHPGKQIVIKSGIHRRDQSPETVATPLWNGKPLESFFIDHKELIKGGELIIH